MARRRASVAGAGWGCGSRLIPGASGLDEAGDVAGDLVAATARQRELPARAHLGEARPGAGELEALVAVVAPIEPRRLGGGRHDQLPPPLVEDVDEVDEALRLVAPV